MARIISLQFAATILLALIASLVSGKVAAVSAICGGLSCAIPNALFAARLYVSTKKPGSLNPMTFFIGEFIKIAATFALMAASVYLYQELNWLAFIAAFVLVLKSYLILLFRQ